MPNLNSKDLQDIVAGNHVVVDRIIDNIPAGDSIESAWLTIKNTKKDADSAAIVQKHVTTTGTAQGQVIDTGAVDREGRVYFVLLPAETILLKEDRNYPFDIKVRMVS